MAGRKENLKSLFKNTRSRVIIIFTLILLVVAVIIGIFKLRSSSDLGPNPAVDLRGPGSIQSIPGALNPTAQYAKLQETQNVDQAKTALNTGSSAIPTIIRTQELGAGAQPIGVSQQGEGGIGFASLAREDEAGAQRSLWIQSLQNNSCSKASVAKVISEGATFSDLKAACSCIQLKDNGYQIPQLESVCSCQELKAAGFNARQLKEAAFSTGRLRLCGFDACELRNAGFSAQQMKDGGFGDGELKGAGYSKDEIAKAAGLPTGVSEADVRRAGCDADALKRLRAAGVTASAIHRISGCSAAQLKAAGYSAEDLRNAGFSAAELKNAGFTAAELKNAGFNARDLLNAGFTPDDLLRAGFTPGQIAAGEAELPPGISPNDVKTAGCDVEALRKERLAGVSAKLIRQYAGCSAKALKEAGFTDADLANAGFTPAQISALAPTDDNAIRAAGCDPTKLRALFERGVSATRIRAINGCSAQALKAAGYDAKQLAEAGFKPQDLLAAGFSPADVRAATAGSDDAIRAAGCDPVKLKFLFSQGVSAKRIHDLNGCSAAALKAAGYDAKQLAAAGFTPEQLLDAGFTPQELAQAGVNAAAVIAAGRTADCSVASLKAARSSGVSASTIKQTLGCSAAAMKAAGYTAAELRAAGFTAAELKAAGFSAADLKNAGFSAKELRDAGFSAKELKDAGFSAGELKDAGFSAAELKDAGFTASELKAAGFSAKDLKDAGFSASQLRQAGYLAKDLKDAGFSEPQLKSAGYGNEELQNAGFTIPGSKVSGLQGPNIPGVNPSDIVPFPSIAGASTPTSAAEAAQAENAQQLQSILKRQNQQLDDQRYQQRIQQRASQMLAAANQSLQTWQQVAVQVYTAGTPPPVEKMPMQGQAGSNLPSVPGTEGLSGPGGTNNTKALIKTGDILFAVLDTSVNSDEPGPILATIVSGKLKGAKLIGSFTLPSNSDKMVISFNTMSVPGAAKTTSISAYAIDANTARTALSSNTDHHYLLRYGSLFAASFLEGFGNAFQSANTTITVGGTGGASYTVSNGVGRSALENAVIGLATLGKSWGQVAQQQFSRPTTVEVYSGTGLGILFTQDLTSL